MATTARLPVLDLSDGRCIQKLIACQDAGASSVIKCVELTRDGVDKRAPRERDACCKSVMQLLAEFPTLEELSLKFSCFSLPAPSLALAIQGTRGSLRKLVASSLLLSGDLQELSTAIQGHPTLEEVNFLSCRSERPDHDMSALIQSLATAPNLKKVALEHLDNPLSPFRTAALGRSIRHLCASSTLTSLETLHLRGFDLRSDDALISTFREVLQTNTTIKDLIVLSQSPRNALNERGVQAIGEMLRVNTTLECLWASTGDTDFTPLAAALERNRHLKSLRLFINSPNVPSKTIQAFANMLQHSNFVLEELDCHGMADNPRIQFYLRLNRAGRERLIGGDGGGSATSREDWIETITAYHEDVSLVHYFLSKHPSLCQ